MGSLADRATAEIRAELARQQRSQTALAAVLDQTQQSVSRKLRGVRPFSFDEIEVIAAWLEVPVSRFFPQDVAS
jgi:transcriptional regulator with XRE-family HTH domain